MKKLLLSGVVLAVIAATISIVLAQNPDSRWYIGSNLYEVDGVIYASSISVSSQTNSGKTTLNGELEVNNSDVDINMTLTGNKITIDQTNAAGTASTPLIKVTDARTGATADEASEASLHVTAAGAYSATFADGIVQIEGEIDTASGDITLDPAGGNVIVDGAVTATSFDGALDATDLTGDIAADRMTVNGVVATDFTQDSGILVGTGSGTFAEETGATLRASIDCPANSQVFGSADITIGDIASAQVITTNTIAMLDTAGIAKSDYALVRVWVSEAAYGAASTNNIEALTLSGGTAVATETANADYWYVTSSGGEATATITGTAAGSNYINVSVGANVTSEVITLIP